MAFFKKLKDRLFNSSSKIDEGLEAIVSDGGQVEAADSGPVIETPAPAVSEPEALDPKVARAEADAQEAALGRRRQLRKLKRILQRLLRQRHRQQSFCAQPSLLLCPFWMRRQSQPPSNAVFLTA